MSLAFKDLLLLWRDKTGLIWILLFPLGVAFFFGSVFGGKGNRKGSLTLAVIDEDQSESSRAFLQQLKTIKVLKLTPMSLRKAENLVRRGKQVAYLHIPKGFAKRGMFGGGKGPGLLVGIDPARRAERGYLEGLLSQGYYQSIMKRMSQPKQLQKIVRQSRQDIAKDKELSGTQRLALQTFMTALDVFASTIDPKIYQSGGPWEMKIFKVVAVTRQRARPLSAFEITFPSGLLWGLLSCALGFALSLVKERTTGTFVRLKMAPITRAQILLGKGLACFLTSLLVMAIILWLGVTFTGIRIANPTFLALAMLCNAVCFVGVMMFIAVMGRTEEAVNGAGWATMMIMAMLGGGMIPLISMPQWLAQASLLSPVRWGILAIEGAIWRSFTLNEMLLPCSILLGVGVLFYAIGWMLFSRADS